MPTLSGNVASILGRTIPRRFEVWVQPDGIEPWGDGITLAHAERIDLGGNGANTTLTTFIRPGWATLTFFEGGMQSDSVRILVTDQTRTWGEAIRNAREAEGNDVAELMRFLERIHGMLNTAQRQANDIRAQAERDAAGVRNEVNRLKGLADSSASQARNAAERAANTVNGVENPVGSTIAKRTSRGTLRVANPTGTDDAATKQYVDNIAARKMDTSAKLPPNQISGFPSWLTGASVYETSDGYDKLVIRNGEGAIYTAPPVDESSRCDRLAIPRGYADSRYAKKTDVKFLHLRNLNGMTTARGTLVGYDYDPSASTLALRTLAGQLTAAEPTDNTHVATKKYVDDKFGRTYSNPISGMRISRRSNIVTVYLSHADPKAVEGVTLGPDWRPEWSVHGRDYHHQGKAKITAEGKIVIENRTQPVTATFTYVRK